MKSRTGFDRTKRPFPNTVGMIGNGVYETRGAENIRRVVKKTCLYGYNLVDTAQRYFNEKQVGAGLPPANRILYHNPHSHSAPKTVHYDTIIERPFVVTKVWDLDISDKSVLERIKFLKGHVDCILLHSPYGDYVSRWIRLKELCKKYNVPCVGVSNFHIEELESVYKATGEYPEFNQIEVSVFGQNRKTVKYCIKNNIQIMTYSPLSRGKFLNHPTVVKISKKHGCSAANVLLNWGRMHGFWVITKAELEEHIKENILKIELDQNDMRLLQELDQNYYTFVNHNPIGTH